MEKIIITRLADLEMGDRLTALDGKLYPKPLVVQDPLSPIAFGSPVRGVRFTPPEGSTLEWVFYPSQMDGHEMTVERRRR